MRSSAPFVFVALLLAAAPARPCSPLIRVPHHLDPTEAKLDATPPVQPRVAVPAIERGVPKSVVDGDVIIINTCGGAGSASFRWEAKAADDRTPAAKIGVTWKHVGGRLPPGLFEPHVIELAGPLGYLMLWPEESGKAPIDFEVAFAFVDLAGNRSTFSEPIRVHHPGGEQ